MDLNQNFLVGIEKVGTKLVKDGLTKCGLILGTGRADGLFHLTASGLYRVTLGKFC